jgi:hypothetical protein
MVLTKFDRGLAVVFAEDIPETAKLNSVPGNSVRSPKLMLINWGFQMHGRNSAQHIINLLHSKNEGLSTSDKVKALHSFILHPFPFT